MLSPFSFPDTDPNSINSESKLLAILQACVYYSDIIAFFHP